MISSELIDKAGLRLVGRIAKLTQAEARAVLAEPGQFGEGEITDLLTLCKKSHAVISAERFSYYHKRRVCMASLWLLGGSWSQIGALYEVTRQTVQQVSGKLLSPDRTRIASNCTHERLSEYNATFWQNSEELSQMSLVDAAAWLLTNTEDA